MIESSVPFALKDILCALYFLCDPEQLWVLDSVPGEVSRDKSDGEVEKVLQTLQSLPSSVPSRK